MNKYTHNYLFTALSSILLLCLLVVSCTSNSDLDIPNEQDTTFEPSFKLGGGSGDGNPAVVRIAFAAYAEAGADIHLVKWNRAEFRLESIFLADPAECNTIDGKLLSSSKSFVAVDMIDNENMLLKALVPSEESFCAIDFKLPEQSQFVLEGRTLDETAVRISLELGGFIPFASYQDRLKWMADQSSELVAGLDISDLLSSDELSTLDKNKDGEIVIDKILNPEMADLLAFRILSNFTIFGDNNSNKMVDSEELDDSNIVAKGDANRSGFENPDTDGDIIDDTAGKICEVLTSYVDHNCDGIPDEQCTTNTYDADGNKLQWLGDTDCNGTPDEIVESYTYDEGGHLRKSFDSATSYCVEYEHDSHGNLLSKNEDRNCDGTLDGMCTTYGYDRNGNQIFKQLDNYCDGDELVCEYQLFDESGKLINSATDIGCTGLVNKACRHYAYGDNGKKLSEELDSDCDGSIDELIEEFSYDEDGNMLSSMTKDYLFPDNERACKTFTYDEDGNMLTEIWDFYCQDSHDLCHYYSYDDNGNLAEFKSDNECNNNFEKTTNYAYDSKGRVLTEEIFDEFAEHTLVCHNFSYDEMGNILTEENDHDCDGIPDEHCRTNTYNANGNLLTTRDDLYCDDQPWDCYKYTYKCFGGKKLRVEASWTNGGNVDLTHSANENVHGNIEVTQSSNEGISPEVLLHTNPGPGDYEYEISAVYTQPTDGNCTTVPSCVHYEDNCDICGCDCSPECSDLRICCNDCDVCEDKTICEPMPVEVKVRVYQGNSSSALDEFFATLEDKNDALTLRVKREDREWSAEEITEALPEPLPVAVPWYELEVKQSTTAESSESCVEDVYYPDNQTQEMAISLKDGDRLINMSFCDDQATDWYTYHSDEAGQMVLLKWTDPATSNEDDEDIWWKHVSILPLNQDDNLWLSFSDVLPHKNKCSNSTYLLGDVSSEFENRYYSFGVDVIPPGTITQNTDSIARLPANHLISADIKPHKSSSILPSCASLPAFGQLYTAYVQLENMQVNKSYKLELGYWSNSVIELRTSCGPDGVIIDCVNEDPKSSEFTADIDAVDGYCAIVTDSVEYAGPFGEFPDSRNMLLILRQMEDADE